jgi:hypothetical protein
MSSSEAPRSATPYDFNLGYPTQETSRRARDDADLQRAVTAYRFWYPAVSVEGIFNGNRAAGIKDNEAFGIAACGPRQVGFTLNSDTPYGSGTIDVAKGPMVIELPPGAYIGLVDDHYQGWVLDMGLWSGRLPLTRVGSPATSNLRPDSPQWLIPPNKSENHGKAK